MYPVLLHVRGTPVSTYTLLFVLGVLVALALTVREGSRYNLPPLVILDAALWALVVAGLGGRLGYVAANSEFFAGEPGKALAFWSGGSSAPGALLGGLIGLQMWAVVRRGLRGPGQPAGEATSWRRQGQKVGDAAAPGLALGGAFFWAGCLMIGAAWGRQGGVPPHLNLPDLYGVANPRFPTQTVGILLCLGIGGVVWGLRPLASPRTGRWTLWPGALLLLSVSLLAGSHFLLDFTRGDEMPTWGGLRLGQWGDLAVLALTVVFHGPKFSKLWRDGT
jgi:prolipoprotein diacylglyceryltransferase